MLFRMGPHTESAESSEFSWRAERTLLTLLTLCEAFVFCFSAGGMGAEGINKGRSSGDVTN